MVYRFIQRNHKQFGVRWLLKRLGIVPNAYYSYLKQKKKPHIAKKQAIQTAIQKIYHKYNGIPGHRMMKVFLERQGINISKTTVHHYMNKSLQLKSIVRRKKPGYQKGNTHKTFQNLIKQEFTACKPNEKWCTDFTYLFLSDGRKRYNCSIVDLYDRSVVASVNGKEITSQLAIKALKSAIERQPTLNAGMILHSDQGSQYCSKEFTEFCQSQNITQSMSRAGCPYDNSPMERYFNTLKNECVYIHHFHNDAELDTMMDDFAFAWYNHVRPHTFNVGLTPFQARFKMIKF